MNSQEAETVTPDPLPKLFITFIHILFYTKLLQQQTLG